MNRKLFIEWESWIRTGQGNRVKDAILKLPKILPREQIVVVANLARRVSLYATALSYLNPIVRGKISKVSPPTPLETAEYAASLSYVGAQEEAKNLLSHLDPKTLPIIYLFQSYILFSKWDYESAIVPLDEYLSTDLAPYERLVARVNRAAAFVHERKYSEVVSELESLLVTLTQEGHRLLQANAFEMLAQCHIAEKRFSEAYRCLSEAERLIEQCDNLDKFYIRKWRVIAEYLENKTKLDPLRMIQKEAKQRSHYETVRQCDSLLAVTQRNEKDLWKVYFGTPFARFRDRLLKDYGWQGELLQSYQWNLAGDDVAKRVISRTQLQEMKGYKKGQLLDRLFQSLTRDFYRPARVGYLHQLAFPGEHYNPESTPAKVHEAIRRLRNWLKQGEIDIDIQFVEAGYEVSSNQWSIVVEPPTQGPQSALDESLNQLVQIAPPNFSSQQIGVLLKISDRSATRLLKEALQRGIVVRERVGRNTRFKVAK